MIKKKHEIERKIREIESEFNSIKEKYVQESGAQTKLNAFKNQFDLDSGNLGRDIRSVLSQMEPNSNKILDCVMPGKE